MLQAIDAETRILKSPGQAAASRLAALMSSLVAYRVPVTVFIAAALLLAAGLMLLTFQLRTAKDQLRTQRALWLQQQEDLKRQLTEKPSGALGENSVRNADRPVLGNTSPTNRLVSVMLRLGQSREAGELKRVVLFAESQLLVIHLVLPEATRNIRTYRATIKTDEGKIVWMQTNLPLSEIDGKPSAVFLVESQQLKPGDYVVTLLGMNSVAQEKELADYVLRVVRAM
jgi:hypothetical protein